MKTVIPIALVCVCLVALLRVGATGPDPEEASLPRQIRVTVQFVELPQTMATELLAAPDRRGHILHRQVMERVKNGDAEIIESATVIAKSGQKATVESIREFTYPSPSGIINLPPPMPDAKPDEPQAAPLVPPARRPRFRPPVTPCWDTRNVGTTMEIEPCLSDDESIIDLRFLPEMATLPDMVKWMEFRDAWGDASMRMPVLQTQRVNTSVFLTPGWFELAAVLAPKPAASGPVPDRRILLFVRADIIVLRPPQLDQPRSSP